MLRRSLLAPLALIALVAAAVFAPAASAAGVKLNFLRSPYMQLTGAGIGGEYDAYFNADHITVSTCGRGKMPIAMGWNGPGIMAIPSFYTGSTLESGYMLHLRAPINDAKIQAITVCSTQLGPKDVKKVIAEKGAARCARGQVGFGVPNTRNWAYPREATFSKPLGASSYRSDGESWTTMLCVPASKFRSISSHRQTSVTTIGQRTTKVIAKCPRGKRALSWGFESGLALANSWSGQHSTTQINTPFVSASVPTATSWGVTFHTPDDKPAVEATAIAAWVTCGIPSSR